jgi:co-chaperonin GroES (HSP10)
VSEKKVLVKPTSVRIVVQEDDFSYRGSIIIPDNTKRRPTTGRVVAIGEKVGTTVYYTESEEVVINGETITQEVEKSRFEPTFKLNDHIVYGLYSGTVINFKEQPVLRILSEEEVLGWVMTDAELEGVGT